MWEGTKVFVYACWALVGAALFYPFDRYPLVTCPMRQFLHVPCPACGMTRAFVRFTHGHLAAALHVSPLGTVLAAIAVITTIYGLLRMTTMRRGLLISLSRTEHLVLGTSLVIAAIANWAYLIVSGAAT